MDFKKIDPRTLECFVKVAESGSFTKAAIAMGMDQPAISRKIGQLEREFRQRLLMRSRSGIRLTEQGQVMFDHCLALFQQYERMVHDVSEVRDSPVGKVVVGMTMAIDRSFGANLFDAFRRRFPKASIEFIEGRSGIFPELLMNGRVDIAIVQDPSPSPLLDIVDLYEVGMRLVSSKSHTSVPKDKPFPFKHLARLPLILTGKGHAIRELVELEARKAGIKLNVIVEVEGSQTTLEMVRLGYGATILPGFSLGRTPFPQRIQTNEIVSPRLPRSLKMILSKRAPSTFLVRETSALIQQMLARSADQRLV